MSLILIFFCALLSRFSFGNKKIVVFWTKSNIKLINAGSHQHLYFNIRFRVFSEFPYNIFLEFILTFGNRKINKRFVTFQNKKINK